MSLKQVIVVRKDLNMRKGKMCAQVAHAAMGFLAKAIREGMPKAVLMDVCAEVPVIVSDSEWAWIEGIFTKVVVGVDSEDALFAVETAAKEVHLFTHRIIDAGNTEFHGVPTLTCIAIGPDEDEKIDAITGHLKLL